MEELTREGFEFHSTRAQHRNAPRERERERESRGARHGFGFEVIMVKDRFTKPKPEGYRDLNMRVRDLNTNLYSEIQVHHLCTLRFKEYGFPAEELSSDKEGKISSYVNCTIPDDKRGNIATEMTSLSASCFQQGMNNKPSLVTSYIKKWQKYCPPVTWLKKCTVRNTSMPTSVSIYDTNAEQLKVSRAPMHAWKSSHT